MNKYSERRTNLLINASGIRTPHIILLFFYILDACFNSVRDKTYRLSLLKATLSVMKQENIYGNLNILLLQ